MKDKTKPVPIDDVSPEPVPAPKPKRKHVRKHSKLAKWKKAIDKQNAVRPMGTHVTSTTGYPIQLTVVELPDGLGAGVQIMTLNQILHLDARQAAELGAWLVGVAAP